MAVKLDMSKAYDRVEWGYLENIMRKMGYYERWIRLVMVCVKTVTYSILVNGEPQGLITPIRGIRQGDPFSPFLFLLCTEGLHGLIQQAARVGDLKGFSLCRRGPELTHFCLQMIVCFFAGQLPMNVGISLTFWNVMRKHLVKK